MLISIQKALDRRARRIKGSFTARRSAIKACKALMQRRSRWEMLSAPEFAAKEAGLVPKAIGRRRRQKNVTWVVDLFWVWV